MKTHVARILAQARRARPRPSRRLCLRERAGTARQLTDGAFMEPSGRNRGNRWQMGRARKPLKQADPQHPATHGNRFGAHGKEGVDGSSPSEGLQNPRSRRFSVQNDLLFVARAMGMEPFMELSRSKQLSGGMDLVQVRGHAVEYSLVGSYGCALRAAARPAVGRRTAAGSARSVASSVTAAGGRGPGPKFCL